MLQKHRINTSINGNNKVVVELKQDFDLLEILSLKFTQEDIYSSFCSDYGVVCGRISVNNGLGIPNARVSIFVPLSSTDENDPVISALYPYKVVEDLNKDGYKYNLLPSRKQHGGHEPTGTFFDQTEIVSREEYLEVFEKYYRYTAKTNNSGDFMIWGVPLGEQTIHVDVDLSDIGCFSLRPDDFIKQGKGVDSFKNTYTFKSSNDFASLPQIVSFDRSIDVSPFWGNVDICQIGITRTDFDLSDVGVNIEPKAYFIGSVYTDQGNNTVNKNCVPNPNMGKKCNLITEPTVIEAIRFTINKDQNNLPILEEFEINEDVDDDGSFVMSLPMNMDYIYTNEFGENVTTNDPNKGVPTSGCYRFRLTTKNESLGRVRTTASYLVPNIREYSNDVDKSYAWSLNWNDYPTAAKTSTLLFNNVEGEYYPQDYFYRFTYNKVFTMSSFMGSYFSSNGTPLQSYLGIKDIAPKQEDDCENSVVPPPINFGVRKINFSIILAVILNTFENVIYKAYITLIQLLIIPFAKVANTEFLNIRPFKFLNDWLVQPLQVKGTLHLGLTIYPDCESCDNLDYTTVDTDYNDDPYSYNVPIYSGTCTIDTYLANFGIPDTDTSVVRLYFSTPSIGNYTTNGGYGPQTIPAPDINMLRTISAEKYTSRYVVKFYEISNNKNYGVLSLFEIPYTGPNGTESLFYMDDVERLCWIYGQPPINHTLNYIIYDTQQPTLTDRSASSTLNSEQQNSCQQYVTLYDESLVAQTYCVTDPNLSYSQIGGTAINGFSCPTGKIKVGQVIRAKNDGACEKCDTHSGFSEFRYGLYTIIPGTNVANDLKNISAINEYSRRKLVGKLFCEGVSNYSFIDNWLSGSLYFFPFKAKVRWDDEENLDLNVARTKYCEDLVYFKTNDKKFYYRSAKFNGTSFSEINSNNKTLGHPTTIVDLGPRDEFIKEICVDPSLDPNCSVIRNIGTTSYQNFKELFGLYINYKLDALNDKGSIDSFFDNDGFNSRLPFSWKLLSGLDKILPRNYNIGNVILNGDITQLISINCEAGIEEFDLQNKNYGVYNPAVLDNEEYPALLDGGSLPINFILDDGEGYRVRTCLNEPGRLTESSQKVPFFLWDKKGVGFGGGVNQSWDYGSTPQFQNMQGMTYGYKYNLESSHKYALLPMTKEYSGNTINFNINYADVIADVQTLVPTDYLLYNTKPEGFTVLYVTSGTATSPLVGTLYVRTGDVGNWTTMSWNINNDFIIKPTTNNYGGTKQILSTPFLFYFGLKPGKTAVDKFIERFGPKGAFPSAE